MQFVDEGHDLALGGRDFLQDRLQTLLELTPVPGASQHGAEVQRQDTLVFQSLGYVAAHDPLGEAFNDGGLAHSGLAQQHGVVLGSAAQDLDDASDFFVAADHRVQLAALSQVGEVDGVAGQGIERGLRRLRRDALGAAHLAQGREQGLPADAGVSQQPGCRVAVLQQRQQQVFGGDVLVAERRQFVVAANQDLACGRRQLRRRGVAADPWNSLQRLLGR